MALSLNLDNMQIPQVNITDYLPDIVTPERRAPLIPNLPRAASAIEKKYSPGGLFESLSASGQYADHALNAMRAYDQDRVKRGQAPLSEEQTRNALLAASTNQAVTPSPKRNMLNLPGNIAGDIGDILKSIPRIPGAIVDEVRSLGEIGEYIDKGKNPIAGLASAPGVRMLPGAFIVQQLAGGTPGELLRHPVFTGLDLLPGAQAAAKATGVVKAAEQAAEAFARGTADVSLQQGLATQRMAKRPIATALTRTVDSEGNIVRNARGEMANVLAQSKVGRSYSNYFGRPLRDAMYQVNAAAQRTREMMLGTYPALPDDALAPLGREAVAFQDKLNEIGYTGTSAELYDRLIKADFQDMDAPTAQAVELVRDFNARVGDTLAKQGRLVMFNDELYDLGKGLQLKQAQRGVDQTAQYVQQRGMIEAGAVDPTILNPTQAIQHMMDQVNKPRRMGDVPQPNTSGKIAALDQIGAKELTLQHNIMIRQLRNAGYDTSALAEAWQYMDGRTFKPSKKGVRRQDIPRDPSVYNDALRQAYDNVDEFLPKLNMDSIDSAVSKLRSKTRDANPAISRGVKDVLFGIENRNWKSITKGLETLRRTDMWNDQALITRLREMRDTGSFVESRLGKYTDKSLTTKQKRLEAAKAEAVPARYMPEIARRTEQAVTERLININDPAQAEFITRMANQGRWTEIPNLTDDLYRKIEKDTARTWQSLRNQGFDPVYVHSVAPNKATSALNPLTAIVPRGPSSIKARLLDMAPAVKDVSVGMTHQMMEFIMQGQTEIAIKNIMDQMGSTEAQLRAQFAGAAERRAATNPALDFKGHLQNIINEHYKRFDPDVEGFAWGSPYLKKLKQDGVFIPKSVGNGLKDLATPRRVLGGVLDPVTNLFRAATTSLSLRTQIYNIVGGGVTIELQNPGALLRSGAKAREWMRSPDAVPPVLREMIGSNKQFLMDLDREAIGAVNEGVYSYMKGKTLNRLWDGEQQAKASRIGQPIQRFGGKVKGLVEKSYDLNSKVDDFYRMVSYVDEYDRAVKKGSSVADAERKAITATRQNLNDWMSMTPVERSVMRSIFPFYGYMGHAMRFVLRYPFDHPLRTEMMSKLAMAELEDQGALPSRFLSMLFFGGMGPNGEKHAINAAPFNPFGDVANYMTIQGMLGATNPVIATMLEMAGIKDGNVELYPSLRYDPNTGRLGAATNNPLGAILHNTIPQSTLLTSLLGVNSEYNDMVRRDPAAAMRYLASGLTIPIFVRQLNVDQERFKAEVARTEAMTNVKGEALKSGDWSEAMMYPSLVEYLNALDQMPDDQLTPYQALTPDQIAALTPTANTPMPSTPLPTFEGVAPLDDAIQQLMAQQGTQQPVGGGLFAANLRGGTVPGGSLANTTGGT